MRAVICGANGAMGKLICDIFGDEVVGKVSIDWVKLPPMWWWISLIIPPLQTF